MHFDLCDAQHTAEAYRIRLATAIYECTSIWVAATAASALMCNHASTSAGLEARYGCKQSLKMYAAWMCTCVPQQGLCLRYAERHHLYGRGGIRGLRVERRSSSGMIQNTLLPDQARAVLELTMLVTQHRLPVMVVGRVVPCVPRVPVRLLLSLLCSCCVVSAEHRTPAVGLPRATGI